MYRIVGITIAFVGGQSVFKWTSAFSLAFEITPAHSDLWMYEHMENHRICLYLNFK